MGGKAPGEIALHDFETARKSQQPKQCYCCHGRHRNECNRASVCEQTDSLCSTDFQQHETVIQERKLNPF